MNSRKVCFGMLRLQPFVHHYLPQSGLFHRIESLDYEEIMKVRQRRNSSGSGCGLRGLGSWFGRVGSVKLGGDLGGVT